MYAIRSYYECELQTMAQNLGIREIPFAGEQSHYKEDKSPSIIRDMDKCIMCRRCEMACNEIQTVLRSIRPWIVEQAAS